MVRISKAEERSRTTICVDGGLSGDAIGVVEECCNQEILTGRSVQLLLRDLTGIDLAGKALLRRLSTKGVRLSGNGVYTSYVLKTICQPGAGSS
jgi:hypothetical protein